MSRQQTIRTKYQDLFSSEKKKKKKKKSKLWSALVVIGALRVNIAQSPKKIKLQTSVKYSTCRLHFCHDCCSKQGSLSGIGIIVIVVIGVGVSNIKPVHLTLFLNH